MTKQHHSSRSLRRCMRLGLPNDRPGKYSDVLPIAEPLAIAERHSRLVLLARLPGKHADVTADTIARLLAPLPPEWRQTITFDNGTEFARHYRLHALGIQTFFCDTRSPWQKGGVENAIGRLRRPLPRKRLVDFSEAAFTQIIPYNNPPQVPRLPHACRDP